MVARAAGLDAVRCASTGEGAPSGPDSLAPTITFTKDVAHAFDRRGLVGTMDAVTLGARRFPSLFLRCSNERV